jgi:hypothetical protein
MPVTACVGVARVAQYERSCAKLERTYSLALGVKRAASLGSTGLTAHSFAYRNVTDRPLVSTSEGDVGHEIAAETHFH